MGLETLKSHRDKAKLKWWYKLASMSVRRYPRQLFDQEWEVKPRRGRHWNEHVDELFDVLGLPKGELLDIRKGQCPLRVVGHGYFAALKECADLGFVVN